MSELFSTKLEYVLKALSLSRGGLAAELGVNKSMVGRWVSGAAKPSAHNLARLSDHVARRFAGFTVLDWERPLSGLAVLLGADPATAIGAARSDASDLMRLPLLDLARATTKVRGGAYEGFFRSTRPFFQSPGDFFHDSIMISRDPGGLLRFDMASAGVKVEGWVLLLHNQCFVISAELTSGAFAFGTFNGISTVQAERLDGLILNTTLDPGKTPVASTMLIERIADLSGDPAADLAFFDDFAARSGPAPKDSVPPAVAAHLVRDIGPAQLALGGDWLLSLPQSRSLSRGIDRTG